MRKILNWIFAQLGKIGKDKYQHFTLGAIIAMAVLCISAGLPFAAANFISVLATLVIALTKEFVIDSEASAWDITATMAGGLMVWIAASVVYANYGTLL